MKQSFSEAEETIIRDVRIKLAKATIKRGKDGTLPAMRILAKMLVDKQLSYLYPFSIVD